MVSRMNSFAMKLWKVGLQDKQVKGWQLTLRDNRSDGEQPQKRGLFMGGSLPESCWEYKILGVKEAKDKPLPLRVAVAKTTIFCVKKLLPYVVLNSFAVISLLKERSFWQVFQSG